jgi:EmrB/QacA subfamily drug resistance transporter
MSSEVPDAPADGGDSGVTASVPEPGLERSSATTTIVVACLATAMLMLDISVINTALSSIAHGLDTGLSGLQWVVDAYTIPLAATVLTAGAIADRLGRRKLFLIGLALFTAMSALCGAASGIEMLVASRAVQGLGASVMFATALALISQVTPTHEARVKALAAYGIAIGASFAIGPFIGGALTALFGWRAIFLINVPIGAVALWVTWRRVGEGRDPNPRRIDWAGQAALIAALFLLVLALLRGNDDGWGSTAIVASLVASAVLFGVFIYLQERSSEPMLPLRLLRQRQFAGPQIAVFAIAASFFAVFLYTTLYLQSVLGLSAIETGLVYLPGTSLVFIISGLTAQFGQTISPAKIASVGLVFVSAGLALMLVIGVDSSWTAIIPGLLVVSVGTGLFNPTGSALALNALPQEQSGLAAGTNDTFRQTGVAVGIAALGTLVPASAALGGQPGSYVEGLHHALLAAAILAAVGAVATAWLLIGQPESAGETLATQVD